MASIAEQPLVAQGYGTYHHNHFAGNAAPHWIHEYANEATNDNIPKPAQSLGTGVQRQKNQVTQLSIDL